MLNIKNYDSFFFDCDGVILDSNHIKTEAFRSALEDYPKEKVNTFINYHQANGGVSRYEKMEYFFKTINQKKNANKFIAESLDLFSMIVRKKLLQCELVNGVQEFLEYLSNNSYPCFVITGGDQDEVRYVFQERGLANYFCEILGSPTTKSRNMNKLKQEMKISENSLFLGDSKLDMQIAKEFEMEFLYISSKSEWKEGPHYILDNKMIMISDFDDLEYSTKI